MRPGPWRRRLAGAALLAALASPAWSQPLGGGLPSLPAVGVLPAPGGALRGLDRDVLRPAIRTVGRVDPTRVLGRDLLRRHPRDLEADEAGRPVVRGQITGIGLDAAGLARARSAGFEVISQERLEGLELDLAVLAAPRGLTAPAALKRLREIDPAGQYDLNHIYFESGGSGGPAAPQAAAARASGRGLNIGLIDGSAAVVPALAGGRMVQRSFAPGGPRISAHATAVASLIAGEDGAFRGAAPGATLYVADVYGPTPQGGSAASVARGLGWMAQVRAPVVTISLVGPPNAVLEASVQALTRRGHLVVAAVGNDGPAAAPLYPAAYPGVVGVTGLDARRRALPEAGRGAQVDFAAPGAGLAAAAPSGAYQAVRGTSYAAPLAAGLLARLLPAPDPAAATRAVETLARQAADLGAAGPDTTYGRGGVGLDLPVAPRAVAAR